MWGMCVYVYVYFSSNQKTSTKNAAYFGYKVGKLGWSKSRSYLRDLNERKHISRVCFLNEF